MRRVLAILVVLQLATPAAAQGLRVTLHSSGEIRTGSAQNMHVAGYSVAVVGQITFQDGHTGSKACSAAGGCSIGWDTGNGVTFANAGTTFRIGIQDVAATGLEDETYDVYADLVGGTDSLAHLTLYDTPMESGSKTMTAGDVVAVVFTVVSVAGGDNPVKMTYQPLRPFESAVGAPAWGFPYATRDDGTLLKRDQEGVPAVAITLDDGSMAWIQGAGLPTRLVYTDVAAVATDTTPDEYAAVFKLPIAATIIGCGFRIGSVATGDVFEILLYEDPLGTPAVVATLTPDPDQLLSARFQEFVFPAGVDAEADTYYGCAIRPTSTNPLTWSYYAGHDGMGHMKGVLPFTELQWTARSDQSGAFVETDADHVPAFTVVLEIPAGGGGGGGGESSHVFVQ